MRTTLNIEDVLITNASELTGIKEKTALVKLGLEALIMIESSKRLAKMGGTEKIFGKYSSEKDNRKNAMILVDASVWVSHLREGNTELEGLLNSGQVFCHPLIIGEIARGYLKNRQEILSLIKLLPTVDCVEQDEVLLFVERNNLMGKGLGWVDMHLAASAKLTGVKVWTLDKKFAEINRKLGLH